MGRLKGQAAKFASNRKHGSEEILAWADGYIGSILAFELIEDSGNGALIVTDQRVVFYSKRFLRGEIFDQIAAGRITSVERRTYLIIARLIIRSDDTTIDFKSLSRRRIDEVQARIEALRSR